MSVNSKMTALADEVRELSGSTAKLGIDAMTTNVQSANGEVASQTTLLAQAIAALEGKTAAGGGSAAPVLQNKTVTPTISSQTVTPDSGYDGLARVTVNAIPSNYEDVTDETAVYTTSLTDLESVINSLPEAGGGGGSATVETCTVTINFIASEGWEMINFVEYTTLRDGVIIHVEESRDSKLGIFYTGGSTSFTLENIVCNSYIYIDYETTSGVGATTDGDIYLSTTSLPGGVRCCAETAAGGTITVTS